MQHIKSILIGWQETNELCQSFNEVSWLSYPHSRDAKNSVASANQLNENHLISMKHFHVAPFYLHKLNKL